MDGGNKSDSIHTCNIEKLLPEHVQSLKDVQGCEAVIHNGHAVVHTMPEPVRIDKTFQNMSINFQAKILKDMNSNFQAKILNITSAELNSSNCSQKTRLTSTICKALK